MSHFGIAQAFNGIAKLRSKLPKKAWRLLHSANDYIELRPAFLRGLSSAPQGRVLFGSSIRPLLQAEWVRVQLDCGAGIFMVVRVLPKNVAAIVPVLIA